MINITCENNVAEQVAKTVLELAVRNHPGVMSHVCGLFARRAFNVEGIACLPVGEGRESRIWLLVNDDVQLPQMVRQVEKLEDVLSVTRHGADHPLFPGLAEFLR
ncbi:acetolactate synthase small subunit [Telmatospirillum sp.]|uniref:acetolactate synthase small subunit n=1 Tax=Telmatospirillum sp. TaxID=2079197 RepID=UPI002842BE6F|nr:acetolactate synthase small subunit [Telmatospirillum sp.]MDR3435626.1 acetolactate synthase small subunit [Telmatospirillum sp.]